MRKRKKSAVEKRREKRDNKIVKLWLAWHEEYAKAVDLYHDIADRAECGYGTVIDTLQKKGYLAPRSKKE